MKSWSGFDRFHTHSVRYMLYSAYGSCTRMLLRNLSLCECVMTSWDRDRSHDVERRCCTYDLYIQYDSWERLETCHSYLDVRTVCTIASDPVPYAERELDVQMRSPHSLPPSDLMGFDLMKIEWRLCLYWNMRIPKMSTSSCHYSKCRVLSTVV